MAEKDIIKMSQKELKRLHVIHQLIDKHLKQYEAAKLLSLSTRQIRRITNKIKAEGDEALIHKSRGEPSHHAFPQTLKQKVLKLYKTKYPDFGPTLAGEKLFEIHKIKLSDETLRLWLLKENLWQPRRKRKKHRQWRERKHHSGEMIQMDGSHHQWFEARGEKCVLMGYIDDATGKVYARFYKYEGIRPAMDSLKRYITRYGIPYSVYLDRHSTYKSTREPTTLEELNQTELLTHFSSSAKALGIEVIHANSPQAKGRIERLFNTLQDRLVKELRLRKINTIAKANQFLGCYLVSFNKRFSQQPLEKADLHRRLPKTVNLDQIFSIRYERALRNDSTIIHHKRLYQIQEPIAASKVTIEHRLNGRIFITHQGSQLKYKQITHRLPVPKKPYLLKDRKTYTPPPGHPWRREATMICVRKKHQTKT